MHPIILLTLLTMELLRELPIRTKPNCWGSLVSKLCIRLNVCCRFGLFAFASQCRKSNALEKNGTEWELIFRRIMNVVVGKDETKYRQGGCR